MVSFVTEKNSAAVPIKCDKKERNHGFFAWFPKKIKKQIFVRMDY